MIVDGSVLWLNSQLPDNVWVHVFGMRQFKAMLSKLSGLWTGIIVPSNIKDDEYVPWCMAYIKYTADDTDKYLIWFFANYDYPTPHEISYSDVLKEVEQFLKDEANES